MSQLLDVAVKCRTSPRPRLPWNRRALFQELDVGLHSLELNICRPANILQEFLVVRTHGLDHLRERESLCLRAHRWKFRRELYRAVLVAGDHLQSRKLICCKGSVQLPR